MEDGKDLMRSLQLSTFRDTLHDLRDLAREQSKVMAESMRTKGTADVLDEMASVADSVWIACNASSLASSLEVGSRLWGEEPRVNAIENAGPTINAAAMVVAKIPNRMEEIELLLGILQQDP